MTKTDTPRAQADEWVEKRVILVPVGERVLGGAGGGTRGTIYDGKKMYVVCATKDDDLRARRRHAVERLSPLRVKDGLYQRPETFP